MEKRILCEYFLFAHSDNFHVENGNRLTSNSTFDNPVLEHWVLVRATIQVTQADDEINVDVGPPAVPLALVGRCRTLVIELPTIIVLPPVTPPPIFHFAQPHPRLLNRGADHDISLILNRCAPDDAYVEALHPADGDMQYQLTDASGKLTVDVRMKPVAGRAIIHGAGGEHCSALMRAGGASLVHIVHGQGQSAEGEGFGVKIRNFVIFLNIVH